jgi:hypothetical protein
MSDPYRLNPSYNRFVKIRDNLWLLAPGDRIILGHLTSNTMTKEQTETFVCTTLRERTGSKTLDWFSFCGRDGVYINESEMHLAETIFKKCPEIIVTAFN